MNAHLTVAEEAFAAARKITRAKGVVASVLNQFDALALRTRPDSWPGAESRRRRVSHTVPINRGTSRLILRKSIHLALARLPKGPVTHSHQ